LTTAANILEFLRFIPLELSALLAGKKTRSYIHELTDISLSHLRSGKSYKPRESTERRAIDHAEKWFHINAAEQGWYENEINQLIQTAPSRVAGVPRPFADFIHGLQLPGSYELPLTIAFAEEIDLTVTRLLNAHKGDDLDAFKQAILECVWLEAVASQQKYSQQMEALRAAPDWGAALMASQQFLIEMLICFFAALDAEFGLIYFVRFQSRPIFTLVMPKLNSKVDLDSLDKIPKRNLIFQPVRRLLELSYALMFWIKVERWPEKPVGRKTLGDALDLPDFEIGKYFEGTRNMDMKLFEKQWEAMCKSVAKCDPFSAPMPLLLAAIFWQRTITRYQNQKLKSFILPDKENHMLFWKWHHQRWASELNKGTVRWPAWLDD